jgi:hypothetical protein
MSQAFSVSEETELRASNLDNHPVLAKRAQANKVHSSERMRFYIRLIFKACLT